MRIHRPTSAVLAAGALVVTLARCAEPTAAPSAAAPSLATTYAAGDALLACAASATRTFTVTLDQRGARFERGGIVVDVPAGAIPGVQQFRVTLPHSPFVEVDIDAVGYEHYRFARPVTVTVPYGRCGNVDESTPSLSVWYIDSDSKAMLERMPGADDRRGRRITFTTDHLSGYALAYRTGSPSDSTKQSE